MQYDLLLFDLDGTLVDSRVDIAQAVNAMLKEIGAMPLDLDIVVSAVGDGVTVLIDRCLRFAGVQSIEVMDAKRLFVRHYQEHLTDNTLPYAGVESTLEALRGVKKGIVSNKMESLSHQVLESLHLAQYFDIVIGGDTYPEKKPSGMPVLSACNHFGVDPAATLMIGDSVNDILAAKNAGADSAAVLYGLQEEDRLKKEQANYYLLRFPELLELASR